MGQGTLTGLAQLVAEELECDWSKVTTEYPTPGAERRAQARLGRHSTGGSRGIRKSHEYVRQGGAAARDDAACRPRPTSGRCRSSECSAANSVITHKPSGRKTTLRQGGDGGRQARAAERGHAQGSEGLEDRRQAAEAARHRRQGDRQAGLRRRPQAARHAQRRDQGMPGVRRQGEELRRRQGRRHEGRQEGRAGRRHRRRGRGRHLVAGQDRARRAADRVGRRADTPRSRAPRSPSGSRPASTPEQAFVGNQNGDVKAAISPARPRRSRRSTSIRTRTTPAWSR